MGLFKAIVDVAVDAAGETYRRSKAKKQEENMSDEDRAALNNAIKMAEGGNIAAMQALAEAYTFGRKAPYNPEEAVKWLNMAAERGDVMSMRNFGVLYSGSDVTRTLYDANLAGYWFNEVARWGDQDSARMLNKFHFNARTQKWQKIG